MERPLDLFNVQFALSGSLDLGEQREPYAYVDAFSGSLETYTDTDEELVVATATGWRVHLDLLDADGEDAWDVLDATDGELEALYSAVFRSRSNRLRPAVLKAAGLDGHPDKLLVIYAVEVAEPFRGRGLGTAFAHRTAHALGDRRTLVLGLPHPLLTEAERAAPEDPEADRASRVRMSEYWQRAGFRPLPGSDWLSYVPEP